MGAIQNSLNQALATVMGAAVAGKHMSNQKAQIERSEMMELSDLISDVPAGKAKIAQEQADYDKMTKESNMYKHGKFKVYLPGDTENGIWVDKQLDPSEFDTQRSMQEKALKVAGDKIKGGILKNYLMELRKNELAHKYGVDTDPKIELDPKNGGKK